MSSNMFTLLVGTMCVSSHLIGVLGSFPHMRSNGQAIQAVQSMFDRVQSVVEHPKCTVKSAFIEQVLLYKDGTSAGHLFFRPESEAILGWITSNAGEAAVHSLLRRLFAAECQPGKLFLDIGANAGFYGLLAAAYACNVMFFDPQPACVKLIQDNICLNRNIRHSHVAVIPRPVSDQAQTLNMTASSKCDGGFSVAVASQAKDAGSGTFVATTISVDELLHASDVEVFVVKIDTEGAEANVLRSMRRLIAARRVRNIVVEVSPIFWKRDGLNASVVHEEFKQFVSLGCMLTRVFPVFKSFTDTDLSTETKLAQYFQAITNEIQEDVWIKC